MITALDERPLRPGDGPFERVVHGPRQRLVERVVRGVMLVKGGVPGARLARVMVHREEEVSASVLEEIDAGVQFVAAARALTAQPVVGLAGRINDRPIFAQQFDQFERDAEVQLALRELLRAARFEDERSRCRNAVYVSTTRACRVASSGSRRAPST